MRRGYFKELLLAKLILIDAVWGTVNKHFGEVKFNLALEIADPK